MPALVKYQKIALELKKRIAGGQYVDRLPAGRILMQEFGISSRTMHKVFGELKYHGVIEPDARGCWIKIRQLEKARIPGRIMLVSPLMLEATRSNPLVKELVRIITADGFEVICCDSLLEKCEDAVEKYALQVTDGVIFVNSSFSTTAAEFLQDRRIPFVTTNRPEEENKYNWVDWDHFELFYDFVNNMLMRGVRSLDIFWRHQATIPQDNHAGIIGDFRAAKKSFTLFNPEIDALSDRDWGDVEKYADYLCNLKHLPDVVWVVDNSLNMLAEKLHERGIKNTDFLITHDRSCEHENSVAFYTEQAYAKLARKAWKLLCCARRYPDAPPRFSKQRCEVKFYEKKLSEFCK